MANETEHLDDLYEEPKLLNETETDTDKDKTSDKKSN